MCAICILKEQGVLNPEDYVLPQYAIPDPTKPPVPIDMSDELAAGILLLYPEAQLEEEGVVPFSGGVVGTVKSIFRALGFKGKQPPSVGEPQVEENPPSKEIAMAKKGTGLYGPSKAKRRG